MKKAELLQILEFVPDDAEIHMTIPTNDYWRTQKVVPVTALQEVPAEPSAYYDGALVIQDDDAEGDSGDLRWSLS